MRYSAAVLQYSNSTQVVVQYNVSFVCTRFSSLMYTVLGVKGTRTRKFSPRTLGSKCSFSVLKWKHYIHYTGDFHCLVVTFKQGRIQDFAKPEGMWPWGCWRWLPHVYGNLGEGVRKHPPHQKLLITHFIRVWKGEVYVSPHTASGPAPVARPLRDLTWNCICYLRWKT